MSDTIEFGIGFVTGRSNVCKIINAYYKDIIKQLEDFGKTVNITVFILYDLEYQFTKRIDFYSIIPQVYKNIKIKYITPEDIEEEKKILVSRYGLKKTDVNLILGRGYAKARNSVMYFALKRKIDYLLFWDDDEYPIANIKNENNEIIWKKQNNVLEHLKYIENVDVTMGYRCGNMSPIPYIEYDELIKEEDFKNYIDAVSNEAVCWEMIKKRRNDDNGITYADYKILNENKPNQITNIGKDNWLLASGICINLNNIKKIPAFYNPPLARGEDAFFSTLLKEHKVLRVPTFHFHDGFLKYTSIIKNRYPKKLSKPILDDNSVEQRFLKASIGWIKYKPLLIYITEKEKYKETIEECKENLEKSIPKMNKLFKTCDFNCLLEELNKYNKEVENHYNEYIQTNKVWENIKEIFISNKST